MAETVAVTVYRQSLPATTSSSAAHLGAALYTTSASFRVERYSEAAEPMNRPTPITSQTNATVGRPRPIRLRKALLATRFGVCARKSWGWPDGRIVPDFGS